VIQKIVLDAGPLGLLTQRRGVAQADACRAWLADIFQTGHSVFIPEIADYEIRRELLRANKSHGIRRLDDFIAAEPNRCLPITTNVMRQAAIFWADARRRGQPTAADAALDADCILAAQSIALGSLDSVLIATTNTGHLRQFVAAELWENISA
jgi:predicted nucleic acid-binding protein